MLQKQIFIAMLSYNWNTIFICKVLFFNTKESFLSCTKYKSGIIAIF